MKPNPQQHQKLLRLLKRINDAIEAGNFAAPLRKLDELNIQFPRNHIVLMLMGKANAKRGRHPEAIVWYKQALDCDPKNADARFDYAHALQTGGRFDEALIEYERALYHDPKHFPSMRHKCSVLTDLNKLDEAYAVWQSLMDLASKEDLAPNLRLAIAISGARLSPKIIDPAQAVEAVQEFIDHEACNDELRTAGYWQMGRIQEKTKAYDNAFACYKKCKELNKPDWDPDDHSSRIDRLIECWTTKPDIPYSSFDGSRLIFIVGMMRSGTSLTEQMIAQVPGVTPGGEMNAIARQLGPLEKPKGPNDSPFACTKNLYTKPMIQRITKEAKVWYDGIAKQGYITDKQPYNYAHVPLIAHMFPGCKIIHCVREPMDCLLSNYFQAFARPHPQTNDLYALGRFYRDYERTMKAWRTVEEVDMIDLHYEDLVSNPEAQSKRIIDFLGLEWTEDILNFHQSTRTVSTASRDQVRQPMYTSSIKKYKNYEHHLDELKRGLGIEE